MLQIKRTAWALLALVLASCVTINIYFPAAEAEEAARTIVRDVLGKDAEVNIKKSDKQSMSLLDSSLRVASTVLGSFVGQAHAAQPNIDISSPAISQVRDSMQQRQSQLDGFYRSGAAGFDVRGLVTIRDLASVSLRDRSRLKKLVANENADRNRLYSEIASANGHPEWAAQVQATFARVWADEARTGYWVQTSNGAWSQR